MSAVRARVADVQEKQDAQGGGATQVTVLGRLAGRCYDRRRLVLALWILALIGVTVLAQVVGTRFQNKFTSGNTESQQAANLLMRASRPRRATRPTSSSTRRRPSPTTNKQSTTWSPPSVPSPT